MSEQAGTSELQKTSYERENDRGIFKNSLMKLGLSEEIRIEALDNIERDSSGKVTKMEGHLHLEAGETIVVGDNSIKFLEEADLPVSVRQGENIYFGGYPVSVHVDLMHGEEHASLLIAQLEINAREEGKVFNRKEVQEAIMRLNLGGYVNSDVQQFSVDNQNRYKQKANSSDPKVSEITFDDLKTKADSYERAPLDGYSSSPYRQISKYVGRNLDNDYRNSYEVDGKVPEGASFPSPNLNETTANLVSEGVGDLRFSTDTERDEVSLSIQSDSLKFQLEDPDGEKVILSCSSATYIFKPDEKRKLHLNRIEIPKGNRKIIIGKTLDETMGVRIKDKKGHNIAYFGKGTSNAGRWLREQLAI